MPVDRVHVPISAYNVFCVAPVTLRWRRGAAAALGAARRGPGRRYWGVMGRARADSRQSAAACGRPAVGTVTAYAAAIVAFAYASVSLYWALGGHALVSTVGGYAQQFTRQGGPCGAGSPCRDGGEGDRWSARARHGASVGTPGSAQVAADRFRPGPVCCWWHTAVLTCWPAPWSCRMSSIPRDVGVWDLWFLVWGILLALATVGHWQRTVNRSAA